MPRRDWIFRIQDIVAAIEKVLAYTSGMDGSTFSRKPETVEAVLFNFVVIGEAATRVPMDVATRYPEIDWRQMRGMRNRLVHEYFGVDADIVWQTVQEDLPAVLTRLRAILLDTGRTEQDRR